MAKNEPKEVTIQVGLTDSEHRKSMFFNKFRVLREEGFLVVHFGLESKSEGLLDSFSCVITDDSLEINSDSVASYLLKIGSADETPPPWNRPATGNDYGIVDIINVCSKPEAAETVFSFYSQNGASRASRGTGSNSAIIKAQNIVLLRSSLEMQKQLLTALYER